MDHELIDAAETLLLFSREVWRESLSRNVLPPNTLKPVRSRIPPLRYRDEFDEAETSSRSGCRSKRKAAATNSSIMAVDKSISDEFKPAVLRLLHYRDEFEEVAAETSSRIIGCRKRKAAATSSMAADQNNISDEVKPHQKKRKSAAIDPVDNNESSGKKNNIKNENLDQGDQKDMPEDLKSMIDALGGTSVVLVTQKPLTATDVSDVQNRLQIPFSQVASHGFLTDEDNRFLGTRDRNGHPSHIKTTLLDPELRSHVITFRRWTMGKDSGARTQVYAFNSPWIAIVKLNGLSPGDVVQVWAFRVGEQLQFALAKVDD